MTILVVGGAGYIGSHTCKALHKHGYLPVVYDNLQNGNGWAVKYGPLVVGDLLDSSVLERAFKTYQPQAVLHFAASIECRASNIDPAAYYLNNVMGSLALLQAMQKFKLQPIVFSSTAAVYGPPLTASIGETHPCRPINVYGRTKYIVEEMIHDFEKAHGFQAAILRYFNAAGADPDGELGEAHRPETHLIPRAIEVALGKKKHLTVFGDGKALRDYIHVSDLAEAHVKALEWLLAGKGPLTLNLGTGRGHSLLDVVSMVEKVSKRKVSLRMEPHHTGDPLSLVADPTQALETLAWTPSASSLENIIFTAYQWHSKEVRSQKQFFQEKALKAGVS